MISLFNNPNMRHISNLFFLSRVLLTLIALAFCLSAGVQAQSCSPIENFEPSVYNHEFAEFHWNSVQDARYYVMNIEVNGKFYSASDLPGSASKASVKFSPALKNHDHIVAQLTKYCDNGGQVSAKSDFIIIDDGIVYISGMVIHPGDVHDVEPVVTTHANLDPSAAVCGVCDPEFFRLTAGFYGPYSIYVDPAIGPIEQLRFKKNELCHCLDQAINAGILDPNGGPGINFVEGQPFRCELTPYVFEKTDCDAKTRGREKQTEIQSLSTTLDVIPNPLSGSAVFTYHLDQETNTVLTIHRSTGERVATLVDHRIEPAGDHQLLFDASQLAPGVYFTQMQTGSSRITKILVVTR